MPSSMTTAKKSSNGSIDSTKHESMLKRIPYDVVVVSMDGTEYQVHKATLCKASHYFEYLFLNAQISPFRLKMNYPATVVQQLLMFAYEGHCQVTQAQLLTTLRAADEYNLIDLIRVCEARLWTWLKPTNCCEYYLAAHTYCLHNLRGIRAYVCDTLNIDKGNKKTALHMCKQVTYNNNKR